MNAGLSVRTAVLVVVALAAAATGARAQQPERIVISELPMVEQARIRAETEATASEAAALLEEARAAERQGKWGRAARRYESSGELRTDADRLAAKVFELAGRAYYFGDKPARASAMWAEAASRALIYGDVSSAARNYMYAAVAAHDAGERTRAAELGWKAHHLTRSPALSRTEREALERHLETPGA